MCITVPQLCSHSIREFQPPDPLNCDTVALENIVQGLMNEIVDRVPLERCAATR